MSIFRRMLLYKLIGSKSTDGLLIDFDAIDNGIGLYDADTSFNEGATVTVKDYLSAKSPELITAVASDFSNQGSTPWSKGNGRIYTGTKGRLLINKYTYKNLPGMDSTMTEMTHVTIFRLPAVYPITLGVREWRYSATARANRWNVQIDRSAHVLFGLNTGSWRSFTFSDLAIESGRICMVAITVANDTDSTASAKAYVNGSVSDQISIPAVHLALDFNKYITDAAASYELFAAMLYTRALDVKELDNLRMYYSNKLESNI